MWNSAEYLSHLLSKSHNVKVGMKVCGFEKTTKQKKTKDSKESTQNIHSVSTSMQTETASPICVDDEIRSCTSEIIRLQETLSERDSVISQQLEERKSLLNRINEMEEVLKHTNPPHIVKTDNKLSTPLELDESGAAPLVCTVKIVHRYVHAVVPCVDRVEIDDGKSTRVVVRRDERESFQSCFATFLLNYMAQKVPSYWLTPLCLVSVFESFSTVLRECRRYFQTLFSHQTRGRWLRRSCFCVGCLR